MRILIFAIALIIPNISMAMTRAELQAYLRDAIPLAENLQNKTNNLKAMLEKVNDVVSNDNPYYSTLFPNQAALDAFIAIQTTIYIQTLTEVETASDAFGTDGLH